MLYICHTSYSDSSKVVSEENMHDILWLVQ